MNELQYVALQRQLKYVHTQFAVGNEVRIKGTSICGIVIEIRSDPETIVWEGAHPKFIIVESYSGERAFYGPSKLKRVGSITRNVL